MSIALKKRIILWVIITLVFGFLIFWYLSLNEIIWGPGKETVVSYTVSLVYNGEKVPLYSDYLRSDESATSSDFLIKTKDQDEIEVVVKDFVKFFSLSLSSSGVRGGSYYFDASPLTDIYVNNEGLKYSEMGAQFQVNLDNHQVQEFVIRMIYKDPYLFAEEQILEKKLIFHWVGEEEFRRIQQERSKI